MKKSRLLGALSGCACLIGLSSPAHAINWLCDSGGSWNDTNCWLGGSVPTSSNPAYFNKLATQFSPYTVTHISNSSSSELQSGTDAVNYDFGSFEHTTTTAVFGISSGDVAFSQLLGGTLNSTNGYLGLNAGATGTATIDGVSSVWNSSNLL